MPKPTKSVLVVSAAVIGALPVLLYASVWALDTRYITVSDMERFRQDIVTVMRERELSRINGIITEIEIRQEYGEATPADNIKRQYYERQRQEALQKIGRASGD